MIVRLDFWKNLTLPRMIRFDELQLSHIAPSSIDSSPE